MTSASALRPQRPGAAAPCWPQTQHCKCRQKAHRQQGLHERRRRERRRQIRLTKKGRPASTFLGAVNAKMEEGNIRAASRILCSQDRPTEATFDSLAAIQERHPTNGWMTQMEDLPKVT